MASDVGRTIVFARSLMAVVEGWLHFICARHGTDLSNNRMSNVECRTDVDIILSQFAKHRSKP